MSFKPLFPELCWHDGRGPELHRVHYNERGVHLKAIDYMNPDDSAHHISFTRCQVFMFTPEEVENYDGNFEDWSDIGKAAIISLGRSQWLQSSVHDICYNASTSG